MASKITRIFNSKSPIRKKESILYARSLEKTKAKSEKEKWKIFKIAQDNQSMLKRLHEAHTSYDNNKFQVDYNKSRYYKKNICEFPEINMKGQTEHNFLNSQNKSDMSNEHNYNNSLPSLQNKSKTMYNQGFGLNKDNQVKSSTFYSQKKQIKGNNKGGDLFKPNKNQILLFYKSSFFQDLLQCQVKFYLENKKFVIQVTPEDTEMEDSYYLIFEGANEIMKMKSVYRNYDDIITNLDHNVHSDLVIVKNPKFTSCYVSLNCIFKIFFHK